MWSRKILFIFQSAKLDRREFVWISVALLFLSLSEKHLHPLSLTDRELSKCTIEFRRQHSQFPQFALLLATFFVQNLVFQPRVALKKPLSVGPPSTTIAYFQCRPRMQWNSVIVLAGQQATRQRRPSHRPNAWREAKFTQCRRETKKFAPILWKISGR